MERESLTELFKQYRHHSWLFVEPGGNWGDHLIYFGAEALARQLGLRWQRITVTEFLNRERVEQTALYLHGGGGFNPWCSGDAIHCLAHAVKIGRGPVIQGPVTCCEDFGFLERQVLPLLQDSGGGERHFFVRERTSLAAMARFCVSWGLHLDKDTALQLSAAELLQRAGLEANRPRPYRLYAVRRDNERPGEQVPNLTNVMRLDPAFFCNSFEHWLRVHCRASQIITNRTHSAIAGAILNTPTLMFAGGYHKNRSLWEFSLSQSSVDFVRPSDLETCCRQPPTQLNRLRALAERSWKLHRLSCWLHGVPLN